MNSSVVTLNQLTQIHVPVSLLLVRQGSVKIVHSPVEAFALLVPLCMICGGSRLSDSIQGAKVLNQVRLELPPLSASVLELQTW